MAKKTENELRAKFTAMVSAMLKDAGEEVYQIKDNVVAIPVIDADGNDAYVEFTIKVPKGDRDGNAYDMYGLADEYVAKKAEAEEKAKEAAAKKAEKIKRDAKARAEKAEAKAKAKAEKASR